MAQDLPRPLESVLTDPQERQWMAQYVGEAQETKVDEIVPDSEEERLL
jgi:hypothetical protein